MKLLVLPVLLFLISGCASNLYVYEPENVQSPAYEKITVFVTNPNIGEPYEILKGSGIYDLTTNNEHPNKLTLEPGVRGAMCGNPLIASFVFLGTIPVTLSSFDEFAYSIETPESKNEYRHRIDTYSRVSIWEWFLKPFAKSEIEVMAEALAKSQRSVAGLGLTKQ